MSPVGFIGTGHIAAPMARFLARKGHDLAVTHRNAAQSAALAEAHGAMVGPPQAVLDAADTVFLCLRPGVAPAALEPLRFRTDQRIVSVMAGVPRDALQRLCDPAAAIVQTIPLGFLESGGCPLPAFGDAALLADLFEPENPVIPVSSEAALNAHFAVCALVPGMLDLLATGGDWLAGETGDRAGAAFYTTQLMAGFLGALDPARPDQLEAARDALATDGTLSLQMTSALRHGGAHDALKGAMTAIGTRLRGAT
jgi:pyrroline-5-carboxylate reductase